MDRMLEFYVGKLGMKIVDDSILTGDLVRFVSNNQYDSYRVVLLKASVMGTMIELIEYLSEGEKEIDMAESRTTITLIVASLTEEMTRLQKKGLQPLSKVFSVSFPVAGDSDLVFYEDPEKNKIELLQMKEK
jgi:catechol 2,3-dioxygenase-like lactoylglutathione lyase family enzyme